MTDSNDQFHAWDILKPRPGKFTGIHRAVKGLGRVALSSFGDTGSIGLMLQQQAERNPMHPALLFENRRYSYHEFNCEANRYAHMLKAEGVAHGDVVTVFMENRPETLFAVAGIVKLGAIASMINTKQRDQALIHSLTISETRRVLVGSELLEAFEEVRKDADLHRDEKVLFVADGDAQIPATGYKDSAALLSGQPDRNLAQTETISKSDPCYYIFTSGTTGLPKASIMSHKRWIAGGAGLGLGGLRLSKDDVFYCSLPLYHNNALTVSWSSAVNSGCTLALSRKFSVSNFWDEIRHHRATVFIYIGELCRYLLNQKPDAGDRDHQIRAVTGNGLRPDIWHEFKQRFGIDAICEFYGASECNLAFVNSFNLDKTAGFCPLPYAIVKYDVENDQPVIDSSGFMQKVDKGSVGLLISKVTDRAPFEGYTDESASQKKLLHNVFKQGDAWFNTGDLVRDQGMRHVQFVDRLGDTFRWKGENVATTEVENALTGHPQIDEAVVYGIELPGCDGRAGMAAITPTVSADKLDGAGLAAHVKSVLPAYAVPLFLRIRPQQEVTGTFKYRKVELKNEAYKPENDEPVWVLLPDSEGYAPLDSKTLKQIEVGDIRW